MTSEPANHASGSPATRRVGRYQVEAVVGVGAFATVYRAVDERLDDTVAVKVLAENHSLDPEIRKRFLTEARVLRRIHSPHIVAVHDLGETDRQQPYLVLEHANRGTLAQRARELRAGPWRPTAWDLWAVAEPLAQALHAVHSADVVHRDLNPGNVLLTTRGAPDRTWTTAAVRQDERLMLADLGLCKDLALNSGHTSAGGTEGFRPPELRRGPAIIDRRADLWSLSAVMVWLVTGNPPGDEPVEPTLVAAGLPVGLASTLARSLAAAPHARHPDSLSWLADVEAALRQPWTDPAGGDPYPPHPGHPHPPGANPQPAGLLHAAPALPGQPVTAHATRARLPGWPWRLRHSAWLLAALPFGLTTWAGFLYIGLRANTSAWRQAAGGYGIGAAVLLTLILTAPVDATGNTDLDTWQNTTGVILMLVLWLGGLVHSLVANRHWLRWRATSERQTAAAGPRTVPPPAPSRTTQHQIRP
ncbi:MAG: serine/threonine-protein kinase [Acidimicrobiales bacterium]